jgi:hypothetical protein
MRISLRSLFAVLTLLCLYLGGQRHLVSERLAVIRWTQSLYGFGHKVPAGMSIVVCDEDDAQLTWLRRRFGDASYHWSCILPPSTQERARIFSAFPHAVIYEDVDGHLRPVGRRRNKKTNVKRI